MSWQLAESWLSVCGLSLLTIGTGVQAWTNLAEFRALRETAQAVVGNEPTAAVLGAFFDFHRKGQKRPLFRGWQLLAIFVPFLILYWVVLTSIAYSGVRNRGGADRVQLARFIRLAAVWAVLMVGAALALAAALINLVLTRA
jgi:hypothetical protein